jgi:ABC-2 type transport system permease protein
MYRAELIGIRSVLATRVAAIIAIVGLVVTQLAVVTLLPALARGDIGPGAEELGGDLPSFDLGSSADQLGALSPLGSTSGTGSLGAVVIAVVLLGVLAGTSDFRFGGIVGAALASPRRGRILAAKAGAVATVGAVLGIVLVVVSTLTLIVGLAARGLPLAIDPVGAIGVVGRGVLVVLLLALLGLAIGVVARNQLAGVLVALAVLVLEPIVQGTAALVSGTAPVWTQFLPVALAQAAIGAGPAPVSPAVASIGLVVLTVIALGAAAVDLRRRDV